MKEKRKPYRGIETGSAAPWFRPLRELLPLSTPLTVLIDPCNLCNFACRFCPTAYPELLRSHNRRGGLMDFALFEKATQDLKSFPEKIRKVMLNKDGEPFLHKELERMIAHIKKADVADSVEVSTNGLLVHGERIHRLLDTGLDVIRFSVEHVTDEGYRHVTGNAVSYDAIRRNVEALWNEKERKGIRLHVHAKILDSGLKQEEIEKFERDFADIVDSYNVDGLIGWDGQADMVTMGLEVRTGMDGVSPVAHDRKVCPEPFKFLAVNTDGSVSPCCVDWTYGANVGHIADASLIDIWRGDRLRELRLLHLTERKNERKVCRACSFFKGQASYTDIDDIVARLLEAI